MIGTERSSSRGWSRGFAACYASLCGCGESGENSMGKGGLQGLKIGRIETCLHNLSVLELMYNRMRRVRTLPTGIEIESD